MILLVLLRMESLDLELRHVDGKTWSPVSINGFLISELSHHILNFSSPSIEDTRNDSFNLGVGVPKPVAVSRIALRTCIATTATAGFYPSQLT